ncbi:hypothetical protein J2W88_002981 [Acidovorax delafieldii]|uniref:Arc-like DNA binding dprotein n=1 Tax=Acidovorax delafieldii TaxID=47920 RepID=A0AAJ2F1I0_ACIDE|nr:hypothetical protein [Acidovorax delafieldii]MDR6839682.1 hypothetical protein [Acidovorax delafieldii]MDR7368417.1 hypothetical protein [Acidovorax delafieldii]
MAPSDIQTNVRLPAALKQWLQEQAKKARRSLTAEVALHLEAARAAAQKGPQQ